MSSPRLTIAIRRVVQSTSLYVGRLYVQLVQRGSWDTNARSFGLSALLACSINDMGDFIYGRDIKSALLSDIAKHLVKSADVARRDGLRLTRDPFANVATGFLRQFPIDQASFGLVFVTKQLYVPAFRVVYFLRGAGA